MATTPVPTITDDLLAEIIKEFSRGGPCPHDEYELLGWGAYVKCHVCGNTVEHDRLPAAKDAFDRHAELTDALRDITSRLHAAEKDAGRWRHARRLLTPEEIESAQESYSSWGGLAEEGHCQDVDAAIDAAMAASK